MRRPASCGSIIPHVGKACIYLLTYSFSNLTQTYDSRITIIISTNYFIL